MCQAESAGRSQGLGLVLGLDVGLATFMGRMWLLQTIVECSQLFVSDKFMDLNAYDGENTCNY